MIRKSKFVSLSPTLPENPIIDYYAEIVKFPKKEVVIIQSLHEFLRNCINKTIFKLDHLTKLLF